MSLRTPGWDRVWPAWLYLRQLVRAAFQVPGITITVLAATLSIGLPLLGNGREVRPLPLMILSTVVVGLVTLLSGAIALWTADPQSYARILVNGRPEREVLIVISRHALRTCSRTLEGVDPAEVLSTSLQNRRDESGLRNLTPDERKRIDRLVRKLRRLVRRQHGALLRTEAMKKIASDDFGIPQRRLCDHLFQYSPSMHRHLLLKYLERWQDLLNLHHLEQKRFDELTRRNKSFSANTRRRLHYLRQIIENRDLHPHIVELASIHSTAGALQIYAKAIKVVAEKGRSKLERSEKEADTRRCAEEIKDRLRFLHRKQRAHPGFDLHTLLSRAGALVEASDEERTRMRSILAKLDEKGDAIDHFFNSSGRVELLELLKPFLTLPAELGDLIARSRTKISEKFLEVYDLYAPPSPRSLYIVSHGYSRTVLSVIMKVIAARGTNRPRVFFLLGNGEDSFDTRVMEYELKELEPEESEKPKKTTNFGAGTEDQFLGLLADGDVILILLGAECFDAYLHVVNPRGMERGLDYLVDELKRRRISVSCHVAVVAESYKRHETSLAADTRFYGQHFDRIDLYLPNQIHLIVSDTEILHGNSKAGNSS